MKPFAAIQAVRRIRANTPAHELRKLGLRLQAIHGGQKVQQMYRLRGIDPLAIARKSRWPKKQDKARTRSKVLATG